MQYEDPGGCHHDIDNSLHIAFVSLVLIGAIALAVVGLLIQIGRRKSRTVPPFTCPARSEHSHIQITRHYDSGSETFSGPGMIIKEKPEGDRLVQFQRDMRRSQDHGQDLRDADWHWYNDTSAETLVAPWKDTRKPSHVSVLDESANEKHEGLIELQIAGKTKAFLKPSTGDFIHLKPWKRSDDGSSGSESEEEWLKPKAEEKGSVHRVLGEMLAGGIMWAVGKSFQKPTMEGLQRENGIWGEEGLRRRRQVPQRVGDCLAGEITNECPSGKPTLV